MGPPTNHQLIQINNRGYLRLPGVPLGLAGKVWSRTKETAKGGWRLRLFSSTPTPYRFNTCPATTPSANRVLHTEHAGAVDVNITNVGLGERNGTLEGKSNDAISHKTSQPAAHQTDTQRTHACTHTHTHTHTQTHTHSRARARTHITPQADRQAHTCLKRP